MRRLIERLSDDDLCRQVNEHWTVAAVLGHVAFWNARALWLAEKIERGVPFAPWEVEPKDVAWISDSVRPLIHAIALREAARVALRLTEEIDGRVARLSPMKVWPTDPTSLPNPLRAEHRGQHLDEIEAAQRK